MKSYYLPFLPMAEIDYILLLSLYDLAEYHADTKAFDTVIYTSQKSLADKLKVSPSSISRLFSDERYKDFMEVDTKLKVIKLKNSFVKGTNRPFVRLTAEEVALIREKKDNLFSKYLIYLKYYCGYTGNNTDFTAKQFLTACGYSIRSNETLNRVSKYNGFLVDRRVIEIIAYRDEMGHTRNKYRYL